MTARADQTDVSGKLAGTPDEVVHALQQLRALEDPAGETVVPVVVTPCALAHLPIVSGFYRVTQVDLSMVALKYDRAEVGISLKRVQGYAAPLFEAVVIGGQRATSPAGQVVARAWHAVPAAAAGYETGTQTPTAYVLQSASGPISVFTTPTGTHFFDSRPQWFLPPDAWYAGAATLRVGGRTVVGRQVQNLPGDWQIDNGLIRATGGPGAVTLQRWDGASWVGAAQWHIARGRGGGVDPLTAPHTLTVIRNDPAGVTIRCAHDAAAIIPGSRFVVHVDYSLRRGSTVMDVRLATRGAYQWGFLAPVASGAGSTLAYDSRMDASLQTIACGVSALSQSLVLEVAGWSTKNGANVDVWTSNGGANQQWKFKSVGQSQKSATVWYRPSSEQSRVRVQWRVYGNPDSTGGTEMTEACGGWWKATVPSAGSVKTGLSFSYGSATDDNGGKLYDVKGESAAVSGGQAVTDVTPNFAVTNK